MMQLNSEEITPASVEEWVKGSLKESGEYTPERELEVLYLVLSGTLKDIKQLKEMAAGFLVKLRVMDEAGNMNQFFTAGTLLSALGDIASRGEENILREFKKMSDCFPLLDKYKDL